MSRTEKTKFSWGWFVFQTALLPFTLLTGALHGMMIAVVAYKEWAIRQKINGESDKAVLAVQRGWFISVDSSLYKKEVKHGKN